MINKNDLRCPKDPENFLLETKMTIKSYFKARNDPENFTEFPKWPRKVF